MAIEHLHFFLFNFIVFLAIIIADRKRYKDYIFLGLLALVLDLVFEIYPISIGIWTYYSHPIILGISLYTWLLYIPYISFCYFVANKVVKYV